jgi:hypothetical protein
LIQKNNAQFELEDEEMTKGEADEDAGAEAGPDAMAAP